MVEHFKPKFKLGITATPERMDGKDIKELYGYNIAYEMSLEKALINGYLCPVEYDLFSDDINYDIITDGIFKYSVADLNKKLFIPKRDEEIARIFYKRIKNIKNPKAIIFCPSIGYATMIKKHFADSVVVHSGLAKRDRKRKINDFRQGKYKNIITIDLFNEGVDVPDANVVVFLRSTQSHTIFIQQLGRGLRLLPNKEKVLVLDFLKYCQYGL